jgi:hypothetical protein
VSSQNDQILCFPAVCISQKTLFSPCKSYTFEGAAVRWVL